MKYILSKEYEFEGQKYTEIEINLDVLTGKDVSAAKREWTRAGNFSPLMASDTDCCVYEGLLRDRPGGHEFFVGLIGFAERSDPDDEVKSAAVSIARVMKGGALEWMQEPLIELASWNRTITKQLEAEARAAKKK